MHVEADGSRLGGAKRSSQEREVFLSRLEAYWLDAQKKSFLYQERDQVAREAFLKALAAVEVDKRVYVDEAGVEDTLSYAYGWNKKGSRCFGERLGHHTQRTSVAAAWCLGQVLSPLMFEGYCNSAVIEAWFEQHLIHVLKPGQVVILDNASFHRKSRLTQILDTVGCTLLALPPYSPDLNKIEPLWNTLKSRIAHAAKSLSFTQKIETALCSLL